MILDRTMNIRLNENGQVRTFMRDGKPVFWEVPIKGMFLKPSEIEPTKGEKHDYESCESCLQNQKLFQDDFQDVFEGKKVYGNGKKREAFPYCCDAHKKLLKEQNFNMSDFVKVPEMASWKVVYVNNHILNNIDIKDWYEDITNYLDYAIWSFGKFYNDCGQPLLLDEFLQNIRYQVENHKYDSNKKKRIIEYIDLHLDPQPKKEKTDLNILIEVYRKWLKIFPFELSYFRGLKRYYYGVIPFLQGNQVFNPYLKVSKGKSHTKDSLIEALLNLTDGLLTQINGLLFYEKGLLTEPQRVKMELINSKRRQKLKQGYRTTNKDETKRYRKMIKAWFIDEQEHINELIESLEYQEKQLSSQKPLKNPPKCLITISPIGLVDKLFEGLKSHFEEEQHQDLKKVLKGDKVDDPLLFLGNANQLTEVFKRLLYNGHLIHNKTYVTNWICTTFQYYKGNTKEASPFKESNVYQVLRLVEKEPSKKNRICQFEWLPFKEDK